MTKKKAAKRKTKKKASKRKAKKKATPPNGKNNGSPKSTPVELARKRRHLALMNKVAGGVTLSPVEMRELEIYESERLPDGVVRTQAELARELGITTRTVKNWVRDGCPKTDDGNFNVEAVRTWRDDRGDDDLDEEARAADVTWKRLRAARAKLEYDEAAGKLVPRDEVERSRVERVLAVKEQLLALPTRIASRLAGLDPRRVEVVLTEELRRVIEEFARGSVGNEDVEP